MNAIDNAFGVEGLIFYGTNLYYKKIHEKYPDIDQKFQSCNGNRKCMMDLIDEYKIKTSLMYGGFSIYSKDRILKNIKQILKNGMSALNKYTYTFIINACGSIAHYSKSGWIGEYPTIEDFKQFFKKNEYGAPVIKYVNGYEDHKDIVSDIYKLLKIELPL